MKQIFVSYASADRQAAEKLVAFLENHGVSCFAAHRDTELGKPYASQIVEPISNCEVFILIASHHINSSVAVLSEVELILEKKKPIIPIFIENFELKGKYNFYLDKLHWFMAYDDSIERHFPRILDEIKNYITVNSDITKKLSDSMTFEEMLNTVLRSEKRAEDGKTLDKRVQVSPYSGDKPFIFISYSHKNSEKVLEIVERLQKDGYRVWYDEGIDPGTEWDEFIADKIEKSGFLIAFMSQEYLDSQNCKDELNYARDLDKDRLLVYLSDVKLAGGMAMRLNRLQAIHEYTYNSFDSFIQKLESTPALEAFKD